MGMQGPPSLERMYPLSQRQSPFGAHLHCLKFGSLHIILGEMRQWYFNSEKIFRFFPIRIRIKEISDWKTKFYRKLFFYSKNFQQLFSVFEEKWNEKIFSFLRISFWDKTFPRILIWRSCALDFLINSWSTYFYWNIYLMNLISFWRAYLSIVWIFASRWTTPIWTIFPMFMFACTIWRRTFIFGNARSASRIQKYVTFVTFTSGFAKLELREKEKYFNS